MRNIGILALARQRNGGTLLYTRSMIEALRGLSARDYRFTIHTTLDNHEYDDLGLPIVRLASPARIALGRLTGREVFAQEDAILAPIYSTILLATRLPFAFTLHDLQEKHFPQHFGLATRAWRHLTNRLLTSRAACIVCESDFVRRDICRHFGVPDARIAVVPAPPVTLLRDSRPEPAAVDAVRRKYGLPAQYVFYPAQFWPHKNHRRLVEAFARIAPRHPDCALVLTGKQRDEYERVFARVNELGLQSRVRHIGYVEQSELAALYCGATVAAIPTLFESISIPIYEAFALGTPVCASNVVALPEQVGDAGLLFDPLSVDAIAASIERLLDDPELRRQLAQRGQRRVAAVTHEGYGRRLADIIDALVRVPERAVA
jgi:glycosyltransferase involved in cell wall biosynthesis